MEWNALLVLFGSLGGVGALVAALVNVGKTVGLVKDGQAPTVSTGLNLVGLVVVFVLGVVAPEKIAGVSQYAGQFSEVLITVFGFMWQLISSKIAHTALKGTKLVGKSYTTEAAKAKSFQSAMAQRESI